MSVPGLDGTTRTGSRNTTSLLARGMDAVWRLIAADSCRSQAAQKSRRPLRRKGLHSQRMRDLNLRSGRRTIWIDRLVHRCPAIGRGLRGERSEPRLGIDLRVMSRQRHVRSDRRSNASVQVDPLFAAAGCPSRLRPWASVGAGGVRVVFAHQTTQAGSGKPVRESQAAALRVCGGSCQRASGNRRRSIRSPPQRRIVDVGANCAFRGLAGRSTGPPEQIPGRLDGAGPTPERSEGVGRTTSEARRQPW